jgi:hypothetical protein
MNRIRLCRRRANGSLWTSTSFNCDDPQLTRPGFFDVGNRVASVVNTLTS